MQTAHPSSRHRRDREPERSGQVRTPLLTGAAVAAAVLALSLGWSLGGSATTTVADQSSGTRTCAETVRAARDAVDAARPSHRNWSGHVQAQLDLDAGTSTPEQTRARWAATRSTSTTDLSGFADGLRAYRLGDGGCAGVMADTSPAAASCRVEFAVASVAVGAAERVVGEWAAHVEMMADREHSDATEYREQWRRMVTAAPTALREFERAADDLEAVPRVCT